jgi:predicted nucleotidyltransferase
MLRPDGTVLEQLYSPIVVCTSPEHEELKAMAVGCITRRHGHHYLGFSKGQWDLFRKDEPRRVKPLLYVFRVLLTGIHLMRTGCVEANLAKLNEEAGLVYLDDLIAVKTGNAERCELPPGREPFYEQEYQRLTGVLEDAVARTHLPARTTAEPALNDLLLRVRLSGA